ncbi:MAG: HAD family hydrolase [Firmicutes bacterium]|nr:HAD family hydrolase [Bacillota bacterium]
MERFIFDLDGTLLDLDFSYEDVFFEEQLGEELGKQFNKVKVDLLDQYEFSHKNYDVDLLSEFLSMKSGIDITPKLIDEWIFFNSTVEDRVHDGVYEVLDYLKSKGKSIALLTNWFSKTQIERLRKAGIYEYFDDICCGETFIKPYYKSYINACGNYDIKDSIMIGDNLDKDVLAPRNIGMASIHYNNKEKVDDSTIKSLRKIKEMF